MRAFARWVYRSAAALLKRWGGRVSARRREAPRHFRRVVVVRMWAVGELVMATPVLRTLRESFPEARVELLAGRALAPLARGLPWIDEVLEVDEGPLLRGNLVAWLRLIRRLRAGRFDLGICLHQSVLLAVLLWLGGVRWRVGFDRDGEGFSHHVRVPCNVAGRHQVHEYLATVRAMGLEPSSALPALAFDAAADGRAATALPAEGILIGLAPTGGDNVAAGQLGTNVHLKRWPSSAYVELARRLSSRGDVTVVVLGGPAEVPAGQAIAQGVPGVLDLTGKLDLPALAAVCARLRLVVTNDSGPMHVAAAVETPVLALFGPTDPRLTGPYSPQARVVTHPVTCSPCFRRDAVPPTFPDCPHQRCMAEISPQAVARLVWEMLEGGERSGPGAEPPYVETVL